MTDSDLTDRIADAISGVDDWRGVTDPKILAAAIVAELGLRRASRPSDYGHVDYPPGYQYVTKWIADD